MHEVDLAAIPGLSASEAKARLERDGPNEIARGGKRGLLRTIADVVREPMLLLLLACGGIYLVLGDRGEAALLLSFVVLVVGITIYQERKTERAVDALRDLSSPRARVIRDGAAMRIAGRDVVVGDVVLLAEGDRVPADARLLSARNLSADESLLTGESVPVRKRGGLLAEGDTKPGGDDLPFAYSGTLIVSGQGVAEVTHTGERTQLGRIGKALAALEPERTILQREVDRVVRTLTIAGLLLCAAVVALYVITSGRWLQGFLAGITLAMAMLPEEFPVVLTVFLALGAWRISKRNVLTRRVPAIEMLGSTTVLCVDKTGTLTQNRMTVQAIDVAGDVTHVNADDDADLPESVHRLVEYSILASQRDPFDPMEIAFKQLGLRKLEGTEHLHADWTLVREYPLSPELLAMSHVWRSPDGDDYVIAAKGAPEAIVDLCHLDDERSRDVTSRVLQLADRGLRVLAVACAHFRRGDLPDHPHAFDFEFIGLVGLADPVRVGVGEALAQCRRAGVHVSMITGDYAGTARSIARQIGLTRPDDVITGAEIDAWDAAALRERLRGASVFARTVPEQKLRIVEAQKANGEVVAMTGDGVNDAPALKAAHIGIAMGGRGTDVARESAALVLVDDDFNAIVAAIRLGRRIFDNLRKAMAYILAVHVPIAGASLIPVLLGWPSIVTPVHIAVLEMLIDPACSIVFEAEHSEGDVMDRPPRRVGEPLLGRRVIVLSVLQGTVVLACVLGVFAFARSHGLAEGAARALAFSTLVFSNLALILTNRSWSSSLFSVFRARSPALWLTLAGAIGITVAVLSTPALQHLFRLAPVAPWHVLACVAVALGAVLWFELFKVFSRSARTRTHGRFT